MRARFFAPATMTASFCSPSRMSARSAPPAEESKRNWQLTQSIVDTIRDPLVVLENDMTIVTASKAFLTMFGITEAEARGRRVSELRPASMGRAGAAPFDGKGAAGKQADRKFRDRG